MRCPQCHSDNPEGAKLCGHCQAPLPHSEGPQYAPTESAPNPQVRELVPGTIFARRYQVIEDLGRGGMGRVYKVLDTEVKEKLALKLLNPEIASDAATIERFRNELKLARTVSHRNICRMYDLGREEGTYFITMEYVSGEDLKSLIHRIGALPVGKAVTIARQVGEGLAEAHRLGIVHRDLKPHNIMIDREGNARIMDFGIARSVTAKGITGAGMMIGTPEYMSPEQVDGKDADRRSDIYALGIVLFEMLTGRLPFEGDTPLSVAVKQKSEPAPDPRKLNPQIPEDLEHVVLKCLEKPREKRYQNAEALLAELARIEKTLPTTTQPLPIHRPSTSKQITVRLPSKKFWIPAVVILAAVLAFVIWQFIPERQTSKRSIAVIAFRNQTGDKAFDYLQEAIPNLLITSLEQSGHFRVTSWQRLKDLLRQSGREETAALDEETGFDLCRRDNIETVVIGSYIKAGEEFATDVKVLDVGTKQLLKSASSKGEGVASILKTQIDQLSRTISRGIGLPVLKIEKAQPKIIDLTTNSLDAYAWLLRGINEGDKFYYAAARESLGKAIELDPTFAVAHLRLAFVFGSMGDYKSREESLKKAHQYADKASQKERLIIESQYAAIIEHNPDKQYRLLKELVDKYPGEKDAHYLLGFYNDNRRIYPEAIAEYEKAIALDPNFGLAINQVSYSYAQTGDLDTAIRYLQRYSILNPGDANPIDSMAEFYMRQGKLDEAAAKYKDALAAKPDFYASCQGLAYVYALQENYAEAEHWQAEFIRVAPSAAMKIGANWYKAYLQYLLGRWDDSLAEYLALRKQAELAQQPYFLAVTDWILGFLHCDRGEFDAARTSFQSFLDWDLKMNPTLAGTVKAEQAVFRCLVDLGQERAESAGARLNELGSQLPDVDSANRTLMTFYFELLSAEIALAESKVDEAVGLAEKIVLLSFPTMNTPDLINYNIPFLKDVLARAYWKKGELGKAAAEYQKLMTIDPNNQIRYLIHPLYHYRLGRVLEEKGEKDKARLQYEKFLVCWKNADARHPELADARKRLAALKNR